MASRSPKERGLITREVFGNALPFNFAKINSTDFVRCVPAVVRGWCTVMEPTSATPIQQAPRSRREKRVSSAISVVLAARLSRCCHRIDCLTDRSALTGYKGISIAGRGSRPKAWTLRPGLWRPVASSEPGVL
jgi:hypothetical protein